VLTEEEEKKLLDIIFAETTLDVSFVSNEDFNAALVTAAETGAAVKQETVSEPPKNSPNIEQNTLYYRHGLRSGQAIRTDGSAVILGDVNAGSEIVAGGNIIVLGTLRGMVHAGAGGDESCYVSALNLQPTQLRIAGVITSIQREKGEKGKARNPEYAFIQAGQVYVERL
jgi:septum site-determining protein MinC